MNAPAPGVAAARHAGLDPDTASLTEVLAAHGYTHRPATMGAGSWRRQEVLDADGVVVATGTAADVWTWLDARVAAKCADAATHTPMPAGYVEHALDAERRLERGERQAQCPTCGLWAIWLDPTPSPITSPICGPGAGSLRSSP